MAGPSNCFATDLMPYVIISTCANMDLLTIYFSGTAQKDVGNIKLIEEYIVSMATIVYSNRWFRRSA